MAIRWGVLGAGTFASAMVGPVIHAARGAELYAVAARDAERARVLAPTGPAYGSYGDLIADPDVDAVYVALHNEAHVKWALAAVAAGKHVLCEKPLALCAADVDTLAAAAGVHNRLVCEALMYRWHPRTRLAHELLAAGRIGPVRHVAAGFTFGGVAPGSYRLDRTRGGGALFDLGGYALSAVLAAFGSEPRDVAAQLRSGPTGVDLAADLVLTFDAGEAEVHVGMDEPERQWCVITGESGEIELAPPAYTAWLGSNAALLVSDGSRTERIAVPDTDAYRVMVEEVTAVIAGGDGFVLPLDRSRAIAAVIDAALRLAGDP